MSNKRYYKTVSQKNDNVLAMEFDYDHGGGVLFDLINLTSRELHSGEEFESVHEITKYEYEDLVRAYFIKLGDTLASGTGGGTSEEEFNDAMGLIVEDILEPEKEKPFEPKTAFSLMHKDIQVGGFSERTTMELISFISILKENGYYMLIKNIDGEIVAMIDAKTVVEASFEFESF
jgi:hypothetical protein